MTGRLTSGARVVVSTVFAVLAFTVLAVAIAARVGPTFGMEFFSIQSGSMEPTLPVGSLVIVSTGSAGGVAVGDAVAFRLPKGGTVTHRVVELVELEGEGFLRTRGDANADPDPVLAAESAVIGPVVASMPLLGFVLGMLGLPIGVVAILFGGGALLTAIWLLEELEQLGRRAARVGPDDARTVMRQQARGWQPHEHGRTPCRRHAPTVHRSRGAAGAPGEGLR